MDVVMAFLSLNVFIKFLCSLMLFIHLLFGSSLAVFLPFLEPAPFCLPDLFCLLIFLAQNLDVLSSLLFMITPLPIKALMSAFVMASFISSILPGSNLILFSPHFKMSAASLLCTPSILYLLCEQFVLLFL